MSNSAGPTEVIYPEISRRHPLQDAVAYSTSRERERERCDYKIDI